MAGQRNSMLEDFAGARENVIEDVSGLVQRLCSKNLHLIVFTEHPLQEPSPTTIVLVDEILKIQRKHFTGDFLNH